MAKTKSGSSNSGIKKVFYKNSGKRTSIGRSDKTKPKNKSKRLNFKKYIGQGR